MLFVDWRTRFLAVCARRSGACVRLKDEVVPLLQERATFRR
jgi:hypothetical protein